jgi:hypothetical protein
MHAPSESDHPDHIQRLCLTTIHPHLKFSDALPAAYLELLPEQYEYLNSSIIPRNKRQIPQRLHLLTHSYKYKKIFQT